jgi:hypothetical protein
LGKSASGHDHGSFAFARALRSGKRAAAIMSVIQSALLTRQHDPNAYWKDVLTRLPTQRANKLQITGTKLACAAVPLEWKRSQSSSFIHERVCYRLALDHDPQDYNLELLGRCAGDSH